MRDQAPERVIKNTSGRPAYSYIFSSSSAKTSGLNASWYLIMCHRIRAQLVRHHPGGNHNNRARVSVVRKASFKAMPSRPSSLMETDNYAALKFRQLPGLLFVMLALPFVGSDMAGADTAAAKFRREIEPILKEYCYDCHADGANKGQVAFDEFKSDQDILAKPELWSAALKNVRAGLMPPQKKARPSEAQVKALEKWVKADAFGLDPANPDPGRVTLRRLNRTEYRNTVRDLTGFDFKVEEELPPDDTGYGFDNIGDVLTI